MIVQGKLKMIGETMAYGANGFEKRECVVTTEEQYPQDILVEFIQQKCDLLNTCKVGDEVKISFNLRGREWINPQGEKKYFNTIQGWKVQIVTVSAVTPQQAAATESKPPELEPSADDDNDDLPF